MASISQMKEYLRLATIMESDYRSSNVLINKLDNRRQEILNTQYYTEEEYEYDLARNPVKVKAKTPVLLKIYFIMAALCSLTAIFNGLKLFILVVSVYLIFFIIVRIIVRICAKNKSQQAKIFHTQIEQQLNESNKLKEKMT